MFKWDKKLLIGNIFVDSEHQTLITIANKVVTLRGSFTPTQLKKYLSVLFEYARFHFQHEETIMKETHWHGYEHHKATHEGIIREMKEMIVKKKDSMGLQVKLSQILNTWVMVHISQDDVMFRDHLVESGRYFTLV